MVPERVKELVDAARAGDFATAREVHEALSPLFFTLFVETNPVPVKAALVVTGLLDEPTVRLPLVEASNDLGAVLMKVLAELGVAAAI